MNSYSIVAGVIILAVVSIGSSQDVNCTSDADCTSITSLDNVGICDNNGMCSCNVSLPTACFSLSNNSCEFTRCGTYMNITGDCRAGNKSRAIALVLSIFLINFGAANFYIEQYAIAIPQIILGLLLCIFQFGSCAAACARSDKDKTSIPCIICCSFNSILSIAIFAWWLIDLILFSINFYTDGAGCPLYT